ncbi:MAG: 30S ribosome-binding factor RbfA [Thermoguttaceae bacterium]|nr:30S ribosome-binding factor RbfA [Thermoguttaceae bacterium]
MASRRTLKAAAAIKEVVAMSLLTDLKDPRVSQATITSVEVAQDMRSAKVFFTVLGNDPVKERLALSGLRSAAGYLQQKCARRIETRYTPKLLFEVDEGTKNLALVTEILERERRESAKGAEPAGTASDVSEPDIRSV